MFSTVAKIKKPISDNQKIYFNKELYDFAVKHNFFIPEKHMIAPVDLEKLKNDFKKFREPTDWFPDSEAYQKTKEAMYRILGPVISGSEPISFEEAISYAEKKTASGFKFKMAGYPTRRDVFNKAMPLLKRMVDAVLNGEDPETVWETCPKVEIRTIEKLFNADVSKRKQRTFLCCDTLMYIVSMMLYKNQNDKIHALGQHPDHWTAVGMSIFYGEWDRMIRRIKQTPGIRKNQTGEPLLQCFDVSKMEACMSNPLLSFIYEMRNDAVHVTENTSFITEFQLENAKKWVLKNVLCSLVIDPEGNLGYKNGMTSSGGLNTLDDNTIGLQFVNLYNFAKQLPTVEQIVDKYFEIKAAMIGDDSLLPDLPIFDSLIENAAELGFKMEYEIQPPTTVKEAKFMNFGFAYLPHFLSYGFVPNYDKLLAGVYYYMKSGSWRLSLAKLCALRVMCYTNLPRRMELEQLIAMIWKEKDLELKSEKQFDDKIPYASLRSLFLLPDQIEFLLFGFECSSAPIAQETTHLLFEFIEDLQTADNSIEL